MIHVSLYDDRRDTELSEKSKGMQMIDCASNKKTSSQKKIL